MGHRIDKQHSPFCSRRNDLPMPCLRMSKKGSPTIQCQHGWFNGPGRIDSWVSNRRAPRVGPTVSNTGEDEARCGGAMLIDDPARNVKMRPSAGAKTPDRYVCAVCWSNRLRSILFRSHAAIVPGNDLLAGRRRRRPLA